MIRVLVADDQELVREGLTLILEAQDDITVVGGAADGSEAVRQVRAVHPDVVLMDVRMPRMDGVEATRQITTAPEPPRVLVLTTYDLDEYVYEAFRAGASGFLLKGSPRSQLLQAVRAVAAGEPVLAPDVTRRLVEAYAQQPPPTAGVPHEVAALSERERQVLIHVARGLTNNEIATALVISEATVKTHISSIFTKLRLHDRVQAVVLAYECGLVRAGSRSATRRRLSDRPRPG